MKRPGHTLTFSRLSGLSGARGASFRVKGPLGSYTATVVTPPSDRAAPLLYRREVVLPASHFDTSILVAGKGDRLEGARVLEKWREGASFFIAAPHWISEIAAPSSGTRFGRTRFDLLTHYASLLWTAPIRGNASDRGSLFRTARDAFQAHDSYSRILETLFGRVAMLRVTRGLWE